MHACLRGPNYLLILHQIINRTWFSCLADEIAEPRPDMNIKVAAFTVSEKSINNTVYWLCSCTKSWIVLEQRKRGGKIITDLFCLVAAIRLNIVLRGCLRLVHFHMGVFRKVLLFACWAILPAFCRFLMCFLNCSVFKEYLRNAMGVPNSSDQEQARQIFGPYLGLNCL